MIDILICECACTIRMEVSIFCSFFVYALPCVLSSFAIILTKRKELVALLCVFLVSCDCYCSVAHGTMSCSAVFDCGIF